MTSSTFDFWFLLGFRISFALALVGFVIYGRLYYRGVRRRLILPSWAFINIATVFVFASIYNVVLQFFADNLVARRTAALIVSYGLAWEMVVAITFGIIVFGKRLD